MNIDDCFYIGFSQKIIGHKGELAFKLDVDSPSSYEGIPSVLIQIQEKDKTLVPFFVESATLQNNGNLRCKIEGIDNQSAAKSLVGKSLFLPLTVLPKLSGNKFYFHEVIGFTVLDQTKGEIGIIDKVIEYPLSNLLAIIKGDKEILVPITDETIVAVYRDQKELQIDAPEGLIDLYLES
ncbi:MAG: 16S rRNA processing protein RimM [Bacteroidetes bacterium]|nr:MAG: 16S rRNA processing protein RimM [Bacteroidota bacterium]MBL1145483.1 16S rRNA processing protein RimM [Bacteroidota bacterium]NOG58281.1 16S rRNA processing protein RimM [Bacteroidota bacterium]